MLVFSTPMSLYGHRLSFLLVGFAFFFLLGLDACNLSAQVFKSRVYDFEELAAGAKVPSGGTSDKQTLNGQPTTGDANLEWYDFRVQAGVTSATELDSIANQSVGSFLSTYGQAAPALTPFSGSFSPDVVSVSGNPSIPDSPAAQGTSTLALDFSGTPGTALSDTQGMRGIVLNADVIASNGTLAEAAGGTQQDIRARSDFNYLTQAWVRPESTSNGQTLWRIGTEQGTPTIVNGKWRLEGVGPAAGSFGFVETDVDVVVGEWTHLAVLRSGVGVTMYVNGSVAVSSTGFFNTWPTNIRLGGDQALTNVFRGQIDDFSIAGLPDAFDQADDNTVAFDPARDLDFFVDMGVTFSGLLGDVDQDNDVDQGDYDIWSSNAGFNNGLRQGDPGTLLLGDIDQNGRIDLSDFNIIQREAREAGNLITLTGVPEPTSCVMLISAVTLALARRRREVSNKTCYVGQEDFAQADQCFRGAKAKTPAIALAMAIALSMSVPSARAELVVAEDFLYNQETQSEISGAGFFQQFAGGQNGSAGFFDSDWGPFGSALILSGDFPAGPQITPFLDDLNTGMTHQFFGGAGNGLIRDFDLQPTVSNTQTLYFAARVKAEIEGTYDPIPGDPDISGASRVGPVSAQVSIISAANDGANGLVSFGLEGNQDAANVGVYANLGGLENGTFANSDPELVAVGDYHTIVGKLEINVAGEGPTDSADFNGNGLVDGGDFLIWQRNFGRTDTPPQSEGNFNGDANVDDLDLQGWQGTYGTNGATLPDERLTVWVNPTGVETSASPALVVEADILDNLADPNVVTNLLLFSEPDPGGAPKRPHYYDDVAIGTTWADVVTVDVPRLTLEVNTTTGEVNIVNNTSETFDISGYEILSESDSLDPNVALGAGWDSLAQQGESGWVENNPDAGQLTETNFTPGGVKSIGPSDVVPLGTAFATSGSQDLVARWQVLQGADGLLNIFEIDYVTVSSISAVPEPTSCFLLVFSLLAAGQIRSIRLAP